MKALAIRCLLLVVLLVLVQPASADPLNGGFEIGNFTSWTTDQDIYASNWFGGIQVLQSHGIVSDASEGDYFAKLPPNSWMKQDMTWFADDTLTFKWAFEELQQTSMSREKVAAFSVHNEAGGFLFVDNFRKATYWSGGNTTGWETYTYDFPAAGSGHIQF